MRTSPPTRTAAESRAISTKKKSESITCCMAARRKIRDAWALCRWLGSIRSIIRFSFAFLVMLTVLCAKSWAETMSLACEVHATVDIGEIGNAFEDEETEYWYVQVNTDTLLVFIKQSATAKPQEWMAKITDFAISGVEHNASGKIEFRIDRYSGRFVYAIYVSNRELPVPVAQWEGFCKKAQQTF